MMRLETKKTDIKTVRLAETETPELTAGQVRLAVDRFGYSANNISYATAGDSLKYWDFFPTGRDGWGVVPVWGFADVVESTCDGVETGARYFGYWPSADFLIATPVKTTPARFIDSSPHRSHLPAPYNAYMRREPDEKDAEDRYMLLYPLYATAWCICDALAMNDWFGAKRIVLFSASSKTAIGLAFALSQENGTPEVVGVTSAGKTGFVDSLGLYDTVLTYENVTDLNPDTPTAIVDMSGNFAKVGALHTHLGNAMRHNYDVGMTHWDVPRNMEGRIRERSGFFFAPGHIQTRTKEWGREELERRMSVFMANAIKDSVRWMEVETLSGLNALQDFHPKLAAGQSEPAKGVVIDV